MNLNFCRKLFVKVLLSIIAAGFLINCSNDCLPKQNVIIVKVSPFYDEKLSDEENYQRYQHFLFPQVEIPKVFSLKALPNDDSLLSVSINESGAIELNGEPEGSVSDANILRERLKPIFEEREKHGVYEPRNRKVIKAVGVRASFSTKYGDFIKVADAIKQSGADPIVLQFLNDANVMRVKLSRANQKTSRCNCDS